MRARAAMAGSSRKKFKKVKSRGRRPLNLFVEGGALADWAAVDSPPSRGRKIDLKGKGKSSSVAKRELKSVRRNAVGFVYPRIDSQKNSNSDWVEGGENIIDQSRPIVLADWADTPIIAYVDEGPLKAAQNVEYTYDYSTSFTLDDNFHRGLGFRDEAEASTSGIGTSSKMEVNEICSFEPPACEEDMDAVVGCASGVRSASDNEVLGETSSPQGNSGFLSIGGLRIYTRDLSDEVEEDLLDEETLGSSDSEDSTRSFESDDCYNTGSDIDEEVAADYFECIGGSDNIVDFDEQIVGISDDDRLSDGIYVETFKGKLGGNSLQDSWWEYDMEKPLPRRKLRAEKRKSTYPRTVSGRKKHAVKLAKSWSFEAQKNKKFRKVSGEKRKRQKEVMKVKQGEIKIHHGVNLLKINSKLEKIVLDGIDVFSFQPMHSRECAQVQRLADIYRLQSGCQNSGKKRFVTVMRTQDTSMPSSRDRVRLEKLIGANDRDADFTDNEKKASRGGHGKNGSIKKRKHDKTGSYAAQPLSFVSSGVMHSETVEPKTSEANVTSGRCHEKGGSSSVDYGAFELHTTGFGSRMMAKMGYSEGGGLGKDGQGMSTPVQVFQRPKSLGLGAEVPETSGKSTEEKGYQRKSRRRLGAEVPETSGKSTEEKGYQRKSQRRLGAEVSERSGKSTEKGYQRKSRRRLSGDVFATSDKFANEEAQGFAAFEKHTMGFGSRMMERMGFVEGMGLGKDTQGIVNPLVAVRRPKCQGLGANGRNFPAVIR